VHLGTVSQIFRKKLLPPSSGSKRKSIKKPVIKKKEGSLLGSLSGHEDGGGEFLRIVGVPNCMAVSLFVVTAVRTSNTSCLSAKSASDKGDTVEWLDC
jgi:hypothetical protein